MCVREIVRDYLASRERIEQIFARLVSSDTYREELLGRDPQSPAPVQGTMERLLEIIDSDFGGSAARLEAHGMTPRDLMRLRKRLAGDPVSIHD